MESICLLQSLKNLHQPINIPHSQDFYIGRSKDTQIKEKRCSKKQVKFRADCNTQQAFVSQVGPNLAAINGIPLPKSGSEVILKENDVLELLLGDFPYKVEFIQSHSLKRKISPSLERNKFENLANNSSNEVESVEVPPKMPKLSTTEKDSWETFDDGGLLVLSKDDLRGSKKIAAYDMDGTLITTKSGLVFPRDSYDWRILYSEVPGKLKQLQSDGFKIVIFTNQAGIGSGKQSVGGMKAKIFHIVKKLGISAQVFVSTGRTKYRKPYPEMWNFFASKYNNGIEIENEDSFYVGDAAGRPEIKKVRKKDHSCADRLFAFNIGIKFHTPEEHFLGHSPVHYTMPDFNPATVFSCTELYDPPSTRVPAYPLEVILLVGYPGSGKTSFVQNHLFGQGYVHANRDTAGSWQKCVSIMEKSLKEGKHVVIDNTNPDVESRKRYTSVCKKLNIPIRCFWLSSSKDQAKHNNKFRELIESEHTKVKEMVFNSYNSKFQEPKLSEGFADLVKVNFLPIFKQKKFEAIYRMYLLEK